MAELEQRSKQVAFDSAALTAQRQQLAALDAQRRAAVRGVEDTMAAAASRLDDRAKEEKLKQIRLAEEAYQVLLDSMPSQSPCMQSIVQCIAWPLVHIRCASLLL